MLCGVQHELGRQTEAWESARKALEILNGQAESQPGTETIPNEGSRTLIFARFGGNPYSLEIGTFLLESFEIQGRLFCVP